MSDHNRTLQQVQRTVDEWIQQFEEGYFSPLSNLARLTEEVGELARVVNHLYGDKPPPDGDGDAGGLADELGDVLFVVVVLANSLDVDLNEALSDVLDKYDARDADRFTTRD